MNEKELSTLVKKTKVLINCVGPYNRYSTPVIEACAATGTHYVDVTGETPWLASLLPKIDEKAKASGAILAPEVGFESLPTDILAYLVASHFRQKYNADTKHVTTCIYRLKSGGFSGGTLATAMSLLEEYPIISLLKTMGNPYVLCPTPPKNPTPTFRPVTSHIFGSFKVPELGILTTSPGARPNIAIAHRSASLLPSIYGPSLRVEEYIRVPSRFIGAAAHLVTNIFSILLIIPPIRWLVKRIITQPGFGPSDGSNQNSELDFRALGVAVDPQSGKERKAVARLTYDKDIYYLSGALLVETAMAILADGEKVKEKFGGGGMVTSACLAETTGLIQRLRGAGFGLEVEDAES